MIGFKYLPHAIEDLEEAAVFYDQASYGLGREFLEEVQRLIDRLCMNPELAPRIDEDFRSAVLPRFPFNIVYSLEENIILVISVAHQSRLPGYWRYRIVE